MRDAQLACGVEASFAEAQLLQRGRVHEIELLRFRKGRVVVFAENQRFQLWKVYWLVELEGGTGETHLLVLVVHVRYGEGLE